MVTSNLLEDLEKRIVQFLQSNNTTSVSNSMQTIAEIAEDIEKRSLKDAAITIMKSTGFMSSYCDHIFRRHKYNLTFFGIKVDRQNVTQDDIINIVTKLGSNSIYESMFVESKSMKFNTQLEFYTSLLQDSTLIAQEMDVSKRELSDISLFSIVYGLGDLLLSEVRSKNSNAVLESTKYNIHDVRRAYQKIKPELPQIFFDDEKLTLGNTISLGNFVELVNMQRGIVGRGYLSPAGIRREISPNDIKLLDQRFNDPKFDTMKEVVNEVLR